MYKTWFSGKIKHVFLPYIALKSDIIIIVVARMTITDYDHHHGQDDDHHHGKDDDHHK